LLEFNVFYIVSLISIYLLFLRIQYFIYCITY